MYIFLGRLLLGRKVEFLCSRYLPVRGVFYLAIWYQSSCSRYLHVNTKFIVISKFLGN